MNPIKYRLRSLMIFVTLIAALLGWVMSYAHGYQKEQSALKQIFGNADDKYKLQVNEYGDQSSMQLIDQGVFG